MQSSRMVREGSVGLLAIVGLVLFGGLILWLRGTDFSKTSYEIIAKFSDAAGIRIGGTVRYRGIEVGKIKNIQPVADGIDVILEISSSELIIPRQSKIQIGSYGLIGETVIDITPHQTLSSTATSMNPMAADCNSEVIICNGDRVTGDSGAELTATLTKIGELYSSPEFYNNLNSALANASLAGAKVAKLSEEMSGLTRTARKDLESLSVTINTVTRATNNTSEQITTLTNQYSTVAQKISKLATNVDRVLTENRDQVRKTLTSISDTSTEIGKLVVTLDSTITATDTQQLTENLETLVANATAASANLRQASETLSDPTNLLVLEQTLDSARATFENAQKITSDLDELTGDPAFRSNVRKLIQGLSNLVSYTEQLEQQIQTAQTLEPVNQQLKWQVETLQAWEPVNLKLEQKGKGGEADTQR